MVAVLSDEGYPQPPIPADEFAATIGVTVHRVTRLEPWILQHRDGTFDELVSGVEDEAERAAADPNCVAYKSIVAYRTGLDIGDPDASAARDAFERWRDDDWAETREHAKPVRDFLIHRTLAVAKANDRPFHFHCGGGDPDINLAHADPVSMFPFLVDAQDQPIVLVHSGYPWVREAAYVASVLPNVYLELSELIPWGWGQVEWALEMLVGHRPGGEAPLRIGRGRGAGGVLGLGPARPVRPAARPRRLRRPGLPVRRRGGAPRKSGPRRRLPSPPRPRGSSEASRGRPPGSGDLPRGVRLGLAEPVPHRCRRSRDRRGPRRSAARPSCRVSRTATRTRSRCPRSPRRP